MGEVKKKVEKGGKKVKVKMIKEKEEKEKNRKK